MQKPKEKTMASEGNTGNARKAFGDATVKTGGGADTPWTDTPIDAELGAKSAGEYAYKRAEYILRMQDDELGLYLTYQDAVKLNGAWDAVRELGRKVCDVETFAQEQCLTAWVDLYFLEAFLDAPRRHNGKTRIQALEAATEDALQRLQTVVEQNPAQATKAQRDLLARADGDKKRRRAFKPFGAGF